MPAPILTTTISNSLKLTLDQTWGDELKGATVWEQCGFKVSSTTDNFVDDQEYAGTGVMPVKAEGAIMAIDSVQEGYSKRYNVVTYALRMVVSEEAIADAKYEKAIEGAGNMARSAKWTQEYEAVQVFTQAFNTNIVGGDGVSLCNTAHKLTKGGTYSNQLATAMSLSETAVETMWVNLAKLPSSNGLIRGYNLKKLVVPKDLYFRAARIMKSEQQNDTANNAVNVLKGMGIEIVANQYFTSTTNWFGISDSPVGLRWIWRQKPQFRDYNTEATLTKTFDGYQRFAVGWTDPRGVYGSNI
jgi:hypothetical protein